MNNQYGSCQYCNKNLEKIKCPKKISKFFWLELLTEIFNISVFIIFLVLSYLSKTIKKRELKRKKIVITCNNDDCIAYKEACF